MASWLTLRTVHPWAVRERMVLLQIVHQTYPLRILRRAHSVSTVQAQYLQDNQNARWAFSLDRVTMSKVEEPAISSELAWGALLVLTDSPCYTVSIKCQICNLTICQIVALASSLAISQVFLHAHTQLIVWHWIKSSSQPSWPCTVFRTVVTSKSWMTICSVIQGLALLTMIARTPIWQPLHMMK